MPSKGKQGFLYVLFYAKWGRPKLYTYTHFHISCSKSCFTTEMAFDQSLQRTIKNCCQACPPSILMRFSKGSIPKSLMKKRNHN